MQVGGYMSRKSDLSKLEEYALNYTCTPNNLDKCIHEITQTFGSVSDDKKEELVSELKAREQKFHNIQLAYKILMNSLYGYFGTKTSRFYKLEVAEAITLTGQEESRRVQEVLEKEGYNILYGDTDSMFILVNGMPDEIKNDIDEAKKWIRNKFVPRINELAQKELENMARELGIKNPVLGENYHFTFKQEMIARSGIFLPSISGREAKKRYDLWVVDEEGISKDKITSAGTPLKQSKLPVIVKEYFKKFIETLLKKMVNDEESLLKIARELREKILIACEEWNINHLGSQTQFNKPLDQYPETNSQAKFAKKWNEDIAHKLKLPTYQINFKYKFIEVVPKSRFNPSDYLTNNLTPSQLELLKDLHSFVNGNKIRVVGLVDPDNILFIEVLKSLFDIDADRIIEKYVTNIFKPYFTILNIPIEKIAFNIADLDELL